MGIVEMELSASNMIIRAKKRKQERDAARSMERKVSRSFQGSEDSVKEYVGELEKMPNHIVCTLTFPHSTLRCRRFSFII